MVDIILKEVGPNKIQVIKVLREVTGWGLAESKDAVDAVEQGNPLSINVPPSTEASAIAKFSEVGAVATTKISKFGGGGRFADNNIPKSFQMTIDSTFEIAGRGVTVRGRISEGSVRVNDQLTIHHRGGSNSNTVVIGIEKDRQQVESADCGDFVGLLLQGINGGQIIQGDTLSSVGGTGRFQGENTASKENTPLNYTENTVTQNTVAQNTVSPQNREETLNTLYEVGKIAENYETLTAEAASIRQNINVEKRNADNLRNVVSAKAKKIKWAVIVCSLILWLFPPVGIPVTIVLWIVMNKTVIKNDLKAHEAENNANAERYLAEHAAPLENELESVENQIEQLRSSGKIEWAIDIVSENMFYSACIGDLYDLVKSRRADSLKEALNLYDDVQYKARMEERQAAIQNASEMAAVEAAKQTAYSKEIAKSTHQAATAAKATAYHTRQIDKNTRRFR